MRQRIYRGQLFSSNALGRLFANSNLHRDCTCDPRHRFLAQRSFQANQAHSVEGETYECGEVPIGEAQVQFHFQFYMYAIIFVVFDVITVFLLIWALNFDALAEEAKIIMLAFFSLMLVGAFYALKKEDKIWI